MRAWRLALMPQRARRRGIRARRALARIRPARAASSSTSELFPESFSSRRARCSIAHESVLQRSSLPDPLEEHAQAPVAHRVAEEQAVAAGQLVEDLQRDGARDLLGDQVVDVLILRHHVVRGPSASPHRLGRTVDLDDHRPLQLVVAVDRELAIAAGLAIARGSSFHGHVHEPSLVPSSFRRQEHGEVVRLALGVERPLQGES